MIVYNTNPRDSRPIMITSKWRPDPGGGQAIKETAYSVAPGEGIDLSIIGLEPSDDRIAKLEMACEVMKKTLKDLAKDFHSKTRAKSVLTEVDKILGEK